MKKYVMLFTFTLSTLAFMVLIGNFLRNSVVSVSSVKVNHITAENSVTCSGTVEYVSSSTLYAPISSMIEEVYVQPGQHVSSGQALFKAVVPSDAIQQLNLTQNQTDYASLMQSASAYYSSAQQSGSSSLFKKKTITAPTSGTITAVSVQPMGVADPTKPAISLIGNAGLQLRLSVNESQISNIKVGQPAKITGVGFKDSSYYGKVKNISSEAKKSISSTGQETVVEVLLSINNPGKDIKAGYTAKAQIVTQEKENTLIAPYEAVRANSDGSEFVFRIVNHRAVKTPIVTGQEYASGFEIIKGLKDNEEIIVNPDTIKNHARIRVS